MCLRGISFAENFGINNAFCSLFRIETLHISRAIGCLRESKKSLSLHTSKYHAMIQKKWTATTTECHWIKCEKLSLALMWCAGAQMLSHEISKFRLAFPFYLARWIHWCRHWMCCVCVYAFEFLASMDWGFFFPRCHYCWLPLYFCLYHLPCSNWPLSRIIALYDKHMNGRYGEEADGKRAKLCV